MLQLIRKTLFYSLLLNTLSCPLIAAYSNYSSILLGDRSAGMGGAFTSLTGDPSAVIYSNPSAMAQMRGHSLSTSVSVYHKYDSKYGEQDSFADTAKRINQGSFKSIPSAAGSILNFGHFAFGLSIIVPDHNFYIGEVSNEDDNTSTLQINDQSLWVGVGIGKNATKKTSWGVSVYYTALDAQINTRDQTLLNSGTDTRQTVDERSLTNNSLVYILGIQHQLNERWRMGFSYRPNSIEISGLGSYFSSSLDTTVSNGATQSFERKVDTDQPIPTRLALGFSYNIPGVRTFSVDLVHHGESFFNDFEDKSYARSIRYTPTSNLHLGYEYFMNPMVRVRMGLFTNFSSHPEVGSDNEWEPENIDMWGFSANAAVFTSDKASFTFGGYYTGGEGYSKQLINGTYQKIKTSRNVFSMLISSAYYF